jgi:general secretion pathway protein C
MVQLVLNNLSARLASPIRWLIVAGIAYTLANAVLYLIAGPESSSLPAQLSGADAAPAASAGRTGVDITPLLARNLFGVAGERGTSQQSTAPVAVATQLPLELRGVFVADQGGGSAAIIAERGRPGLLYAVGQNIAGSATLEDVQADHVILRRAGVNETLHFPKAGQGWAPQSAFDDPASPIEMPMDDLPTVEPYEDVDDIMPDADAEDASAAPVDDEIGAEDAISRYRERLATDPEQALQDLGMTPVNAGSAGGYRVDNLAQAPYLGQTGLQPGDVILSVNGRPVGDLGQDRLEIDNVLAQGSARIEVQRGTRRFFITASLP